MNVSQTLSSPLKTFANLKDSIPQQFVYINVTPCLTLPCALSTCVCFSPQLT